MNRNRGTMRSGDRAANRKKRTAGMAVIVLVLMMMLVGTYAWFHMIDALNVFENSEEKSVVLHDDYDKDQVDEDESGDNVWNKDVYVENTGTAEVFVRIRLDEYMELYGESLVNGAKKDERNTWTPHLYETAKPEACEEDFHDYWEWKLGGSLDEYTPAPESKKNGMTDRYEGGVDHLDPDDPDNGSTLDGNVMLMSVYVTKTPAEREAFIGWVLDEEDGYAYWSQKLKAGEATGLLLDSVTLKPGVQGTYYFDYYYGINVVMEALDETDLFAWLEGKEPKEPVGAGDIYELEQASDNAIDLLMGLSSQYERITTEMNATTPPASDFDPDDYGYLTQAQLKEYEAALVQAQTLKDITVSGAKTTYEYGQPFSTAGMTVTAEYEYGNTADVTDKVVVDTITELKPAGHSTSKEDQTETRVVSYEESGITKEKTVNLTVTNPVSDIELNTGGAATSFWKGETFSYSGLTVTAKYKSGHSETLSNGFEVSAPVMTAGTQQNVTVTYSTKQKTYTITIDAYKSAAARTVGTATVGTIVSLGGEEWIVLKKESGKAELLKKKLLPEAMKYHEIKPNPGWTKSAIYTYLNGEYRNGLHSDITGMLVDTTHLTNQVYPDHETMTSSTEKVYFLSSEEFDAYKEAGIIDGFVVGEELNGTGAEGWWLRSPYTGADNNTWGVFCSKGTRTFSTRVDETAGVRPALTVEYQ